MYMYVIGGLFVKIKLYMELTINFNCTTYKYSLTYF